MATADPEGLIRRRPLPFSPRLLALAAAVAGLGVLFWEAAGNLWFRWGQQQELSHSYFIPLISLWLVWLNRETVQKSIGGPSLTGVALLGGAVLLLLLGRLTSIFLFQHLGIVVAIAGLVAAFGGLSLLRTVAAPVAFLFFAVPPPYWVITVLSFNFQQISSILGVAMVELMGIPVHLSGNIIDLGDYRLQVAEACSGLRYLFPFLSLGVMAAYMYRGPMWQRAAIVIATIPITIVMNSLRIAVTAALVQAYGDEHAEGALHFFEGWVVFLFCLAALFGVIAIFARTAKPRVNPLDALTTPDLPLTAPRATKTSVPVIAGASLALIAAGFGLSQAATAKSLIIPDRQDFDGVLAEFGDDWTKEVRPIDPTVAEVLGADDSIVVNLSAPDGGIYNLYMAYLDAQRDGRSWHSPRQCIPGGGWKVTRHTIEKTKTATGKAFTYNRMLIENRDNKQLVYYWYDQRGRKVANEFVMKFWLIVDAVTRKRSDGAMVRLITPITDDMTLAEGDVKLKEMQARLQTFLPAYVPD
ncbi:MAG: VPLPA-CTERM-specific exosortase XrtD [Parvularculaceae bacterium]|nr:VPLPA-CTERM-specific exosortase XrtD [Parvularculaceae bacterium]